MNKEKTASALDVAKVLAIIFLWEFFLFMILFHQYVRNCEENFLRYGNFFFFFLSFGVMCLSFHGGPHSGLSKALTSNEQGEMKGPNVWTKIAWQPSIVVFISLCHSWFFVCHYDHQVSFLFCFRRFGGL